MIYYHFTDFSFCWMNAFGTLEPISSIISGFCNMNMILCLYNGNLCLPIQVMENIGRLLGGRVSRYQTRPCIRPGQVSSQGKLPGHGVTAGEAWAAATTIINKPRTCLALQIIMSQTQPIYINPTHFTLNTIYTNHTCHQKLFLDHIPIVKR